MSLTPPFIPNQGVAQHPNQPSGPASVTATTAAHPVLYEQAGFSTYGTQTIQQGTNTTPYGYQGGYTDPTGLIYLINRYYDPTTAELRNWAVVGS